MNKNSWCRLFCVCVCVRCSDGDVSSPPEKRKRSGMIVLISPYHRWNEVVSPPRTMCPSLSGRPWARHWTSASVHWPPLVKCHMNMSPRGIWNETNSSLNFAHRGGCRKTQYFKVAAWPWIYRSGLCHIESKCPWAGQRIPHSSLTVNRSTWWCLKM